MPWINIGTKLPKINKPILLIKSVSIVVGKRVCWQDSNKFCSDCKFLTSDGEEVNVLWWHSLPKLPR